MKKKKSLNKDDVVLTKKRPDWLNSKEIDKTLFDNDIFQIFLFYVFYSPCSKFATQGRTLQYYNWNDKPWKTNRYLKDKLNGDQFTEKGKYFRSVERMTDLHEALRKAELDGKFYSKKNIERVAFFNCENSEYMSLFHHIRCALAHGRAALFEDKENNDTILIMENGIEKGNDFSSSSPFP